MQTLARYFLTLRKMGYKFFNPIVEISMVINNKQPPCHQGVLVILSRTLGGAA
jgi:DNA-binding winged helix-turn-helix (wHTH) protein